MQDDQKTPLTASISVGMTRQVRAYEPINIHVSIQGVTSETSIQDVEHLLTANGAEVVRAIGKALRSQIDQAVQRLRAEEDEIRSASV